jgi:TatD DNase family protein
MSFVDSHCHIETHAFPEGANDVMARAEAVGVTGFVVVGVGETLENAERAVALADAHQHVVAAVAFHPHDSAKADDEAIAAIRRMAEGPRVVAVGETGLDYHYNHSPREVQKAVFRRFIHMARELKKPIVIHTRSAPEDTLSILREEGAADVGGVIHCFSEDRAFARGALDLGFDLSFSGIVTFKTATAIQDVAGWAPEDRILVETDAPYLAPIPLRGKRCEPAYVLHTAKKIAELRGISPEDVARITTENTLRRFGHALVPKTRGAT